MNAGPGLTRCYKSRSPGDTPLQLSVPGVSFLERLFKNLEKALRRTVFEITAAREKYCRTKEITRSAPQAEPLRRARQRDAWTSERHQNTRSSIRDIAPSMYDISAKYVQPTVSEKMRPDETDRQQTYYYPISIRERDLSEMYLLVSAAPPRDTERCRTSVEQRPTRKHIKHTFTL